LLLAWGLADIAMRGLRRLLQPRLAVALLREVIARSVGVLVFILGLYLVLRIAGLTRLALTMLGGTGLLGLVIGIAFRDITENVLASILLSVQRPFRVGDLVDIAGVIGYVQQLNVRTTVLMALSGHHVQIPNATVYKSIIRNYTSNPNRREDFTRGRAARSPSTAGEDARIWTEPAPCLSTWITGLLVFIARTLRHALAPSKR
jgi:small-conductance mechanosensitive channel